MHVFSIVFLLGALLTLIPDTTHGIYTRCGFNGYCVPIVYPICDGIEGLSDCRRDEHCCVDRHGIHRRRRTTRNMEWTTGNVNGVRDEHRRRESPPSGDNTSNENVKYFTTTENVNGVKFEKQNPSRERVASNDSIAVDSYRNK